MSRQNILSNSISYLKGVGPARADLLGRELAIFTYEDLLLHFPFRYVDRSRIYPIDAIDGDAPLVQVSGYLGQPRLIGEGKGKRLVTNLTDDTGRMELVWFKGLKWVQPSLQPGKRYLAFGRPNEFKGKVSMVHPELELLAGEFVPPELTALQPIYSTTEKLKNKGLDSRGIQKLMKTVVDEAVPYVEENLPLPLLEKLRMLPRQLAFRKIHFPESRQEMEQAQHRLKFEELFFHQLELLRTRNERHEKVSGLVFEQVGEKFNSFYKEFLPFELTKAQKRVLKEIRADLKTGQQMNRLLQGDVGSGKTIVALMAMLLAIDNGHQAALMAPTEVLAQQHYRTLSAITEGLNLNIRLLTGSTKAAAREELHNALRSGQVDILVGTHALLEAQVQFTNLGLVVIDEQHKFGVAQRARMWAKNKVPPHILIMTATPIPRTLAMTAYGDLETSVIDELPPGRKPIITTHRYENRRLRVFSFIKDKIKEGRQVYIVYPLIEESAKLDYANLMDGYEAVVRSFPQPDYQVSIVHGRQKPDDKEFEMQRFKRGETQIMVSTTVIEVGVDVPNASVMIIENSEKFGLSQLHQLRGRVGRGGEQSYCILLTPFQLTKEAKVRMETMVRTNNGFEISEVDLQLRGPGDIAGTRQSGMVEFRLVNLAQDHKLVQLARHTAFNVLEDDPLLQHENHQTLRRYVDKTGKGKFNWSLIP